MTTQGSYHSVQKQAVRGRLWEAAFVRQCKLKGGASIRYLDLPGPECIYLQHIIAEHGVERENIVAVEQDERAAIAIHNFLQGQGPVIQGTVEDQVTDSLPHYFPFDIINLDFCGQGFVFPDLDKRKRATRNEYMRRWEAVERVLELQANHKIERYDFLLTLAAQRNNGPGQRYLKSQIDNLNKVTSLHRSCNRSWEFVAWVVPKIVVDFALKLGYRINSFDFMAYRQDDHKYDMTAFGFEFYRTTEKLGDVTQARAEHLNHFINDYYRRKLDYLAADWTPNAGG
jgi:hypothetical protein